MSHFVAAEIGFNAKLTPSVSPRFQKTKMGERTGRFSPKFRFLEFWERQDGVLHWLRTSLILILEFQVLWVF